MIVFKIKYAANYLLALWFKYSHCTYIRTIFIEVTSRCNLSCQNCYRTGIDYKSKNKDMSLVNFKRAIDSIPVKVNTLIPQGLGESTINPDLLKMIRYAYDSHKFKNIFFNTNLLFGETEQFDMYFDNGLSGIWVSVDSFKQETLDALKSGTNAEILHNKLVEAVKRYRNKIFVRIVVSKTNLQDFEKTLSEIIQIGVKTIDVQNLIDFKDRHIAISGRDVKHVNKIIRKHKRKAKINYSEAANICTQPFDTIAINVNGMVEPCCIWFNEEIINFGHIEEGFLNTYHSRKFKNIRAEFYVKKPFFCVGCPKYKYL